MDESPFAPGVDMIWKTEGPPPRLRALPLPGDRYLLVLDRAGDLAPEDHEEWKPPGAEAFLVFSETVELG